LSGSVLRIGSRNPCGLPIQPSRIKLQAPQKDWIRYAYPVL
jgi:hypothetical protein